ncbi:MAG: glycosyltransferase [Pseudodesulfovibrio sp.]
MRTSNVSIIVSDLETHQSLPRLLQSVARQSNGLDRTEIIIVGNGAHSPSAESIWSAITDLDTIKLVNVDKGTTVSQARNEAVKHSTGEFLVFLRPDYRLDPKYLTTAFSVFDDYPEADVMYADYIRLAPKKNSAIRPGMVQLPDFDEALLQSANILGPAVMLRREAFDRTQGFKDNTIYRDWDMWVQVAATGGAFCHVDYPLSSCEHEKVSFKHRAEDGRFKSMIVINNQSYFHMHTIKWALSYLRGEGWAQAYNFMTIPGPMDVSRMMTEFNMKQMGTDVIAQEAIRQFDTSPLTIDARR